jgi:predicted DNA-binding transcriptional regulator AlpA
MIAPRRREGHLTAEAPEALTVELGGLSSHPGVPHAFLKLASESVPAPLLKPAQVAAVLGMSLSWVKAAAGDGRLPCIRIPGPDDTTAALRFDPAEIGAWIERGRSAWKPGDSSAATLRRLDGR